MRRTLRRLRSRGMRAGWAAASCEWFVADGGVGWTIFRGSPFGDVAEVELALALDFGFCAEGGRPDWSWLNTIPPKSSTGAARSRAARDREGVIDIGS